VAGAERARCDIVDGGSVTRAVGSRRRSRPEPRTVGAWAARPSRDGRPRRVWLVGSDGGRHIEPGGAERGQDRCGQAERED
jgi:hypothetical protein